MFYLFKFLILFITPSFAFASSIHRLVPLEQGVVARGMHDKYARFLDSGGEVFRIGNIEIITSSTGLPSMASSSTEMLDLINTAGIKRAPKKRAFAYAAPYDVFEYGGGSAGSARYLNGTIGTRLVDTEAGFGKFGVSEANKLKKSGFNEVHHVTGGDFRITPPAQALEETETVIQQMFERLTQIDSGKGCTQVVACVPSISIFAGDGAYTGNILEKFAQKAHEYARSQGNLKGHPAVQIYFKHRGSTHIEEALAEYLSRAAGNAPIEKLTLPAAASAAPAATKKAVKRHSKKARHKETVRIDLTKTDEVPPPPPPPVPKKAKSKNKTTLVVDKRPHERGLREYMGSDKNDMTGMYKYMETLTEEQQQHIIAYQLDFYETQLSRHKPGSREYFEAQSFIDQPQNTIPVYLIHLIENMSW